MPTTKLPCLDCKALQFASEFSPQTVGGNQTIQSGKSCAGQGTKTKKKQKKKHIHSLLKCGKVQPFHST